MRYMLLLKGDQKAESFEPPSPDVIAAMEAYNAELAAAGAAIEGEGLMPSAAGFRTASSGGTVTITDGPFTDVEQVVFGYWLIQAPSHEAAVEWAKKVPLEPILAQGHQASVELRGIVELDDIPDAGEGDSGWREDEVAMRAQQPPARDPEKERWVLFFLADARSEAGELPEEQVFAEMGAFIGGLAAAGTWVSGEGLKPSKDGAVRVFAEGDERRVVDGPFAETKELVAGYGVIQVGSRAEAEAVARRGSEINGDGFGEARRAF